ncbi:ICMT (predicted) [Pycnogonum litorale]
MFTAGTNFNHLIQLHREPGHVLVTRGMYGLFRHPAYVGWFWWSIGTQFVLCNPVCVVAYILASWRFFSARIMEEEITLLNFFGEDYVRYQRLVGTGLPFISGYKLD